jgi:OOP family OmpA-OmpF porin
MPGLSLIADYRVMGILGGGKDDGVSTIGLAPGAAPVAGSIKLHTQFVQSVMFGVRYAFNTPPPAVEAPQAAAAPAPAMQSAMTQSYEVSFDPHQTVLSDRARAVVRNAALGSTRPGTTRIALTAAGDAFTEGGPDRRALSGRRANMVVAALIADGVPRSAIAIHTTDDGAVPAGERGQLAEIVIR